ncbi:HU family DNA-binding protein [bacterium]|jgi:DNA-binding protein HU-beta|nr:HU family DNA-binding protein [bacterium]
MHKAELIEAVALKAGVGRKDAEAVMDALENLIIDRLKMGKEVTMTGFGTFSARTRNARMGVNPQNPKERIEIPTVIVPKFKAGKTLKDALKK